MNNVSNLGVSKIEKLMLKVILKYEKLKKKLFVQLNKYVFGL
jgi:hypothetical protein